MVSWGETERERIFLVSWGEIGRERVFLVSWGEIERERVFLVLGEREAYWFRRGWRGKEEKGWGKRGSGE